MIFNSSD